MVRPSLVVAIAATVAVAVGASFAAEKTGQKGDRATPASPPSSASSPAKPVVEGEATNRYGDWALICRPLAAPSATPAKAPMPPHTAPVPAATVVCEGTQLLRKSEDGTNLAHYRLTRTDDARTLRVSILVPANGRMDTPLRLVRGGDTKDAMVLRWMVCTLGGCRAEADVRAADLKTFTAGAPGGIAIAYLDSTGRPVTLPLVTNGLPELISALAPEPKSQ